MLCPPLWPSPILLAAPFYSHGRHYHLPGLFLVARSSSDPPPTLPPTLTLLLLHPLLLHLPLLKLLLLLLFLLRDSEATLLPQNQTRPSKLDCRRLVLISSFNF